MEAHSQMASVFLFIQALCTHVCVQMLIDSTLLEKQPLLLIITELFLSFL